jgi:hypothetical protein
MTESFAIDSPIADIRTLGIDPLRKFVAVETIEQLLFCKSLLSDSFGFGAQGFMVR